MSGFLTYLFPVIAAAIFALCSDGILRPRQFLFSLRPALTFARHMGDAERAATLAFASGRWYAARTFSDILRRVSLVGETPSPPMVLLYPNLRLLVLKRAIRAISIGFKTLPGLSCS